LATIVVAGSTILSDDLRHHDVHSSRIVNPASDMPTAHSGSSLPVSGSVLRTRTKTGESDFKHEDSISPAVQPLRVTGMISAAGGQPLDGHQVVLQSSRINERHSTHTLADGSFAVEQVSPAADYRITVRPRGSLRRKMRSPLTIDNQTLPIHIELEALDLGMLSAVIVNEEGTPLPGFRLQVQSEEKPRWRHDVQTDDSGQFALMNVPLGSLTFTSLLDRVMYVTGFRLTADQTEPLILTVDAGSRQLAGHVLNQYNEPVPGATVMLNWTRKSADTRSISYFRTYSGPDGRFALNGIGPGEHELIVASNSTAIRRWVDTTDSFTGLTIILEQEFLP